MAMMNPWVSRPGWPVAARVAMALGGLLMVAIVVVAVYGPVSAPGHAPAGRGAGSPEDAIGQYVMALNSNDAEKLRQLSPARETVASPGITTRLRVHGGRNIRITDKSITAGTMSHRASALLNGRMENNQRYAERLFLKRIDGRWYISLHDRGHAHALGTTGSPTASPLS